MASQCAQRSLFDKDEDEEESRLELAEAMSPSSPPPTLLVASVQSLGNIVVTWEATP
jgi:hypothetical protein